jgi:hypothetical protein
MSRVARQTPLVVFAFESLLCIDHGRAIDRLAGQVWRDNVASGLTGEMRLEGRHVRQVVEGPADIILPLVARILGDGRHEGIRITALEAIAARRFVGWSVHGLPALPAADAAMAQLDADGRVVPFRQPAARPAASRGARRIASS